MRRRLLGEDHPVHVRPLNDAKAIDTGANFISESESLRFPFSEPKKSILI